MPLRIAFDCDGVLADLDLALGEIALRLFGPDRGPAPDETEASPPGDTPDEEQAPTDQGPSAEEERLAPVRFRALSGRQRHELWAAVHDTENFWETLTETEPGIVASLARIAASGRWEVLFITQRPSCAGETTQRQTQRWLARHGFEWPSVYVVNGSRGKVAEAFSLDVVVDDRPENCLDVRAESQARAVLVWNSDNPNLPTNALGPGIDVVSTTSACLDLLTANAGENWGLVGRIRRLIGRRD